MSLLNVVPDIVATASANLENLGSALRSANATAASQTTAIAAPAADEVSVAVTALLGTHAEEFQALSAQAAAFHQNFVARLTAGVGQYVSAEAANVQQTLVNAVNAPAEVLLGHPLIGTGQGVAAANPGAVVTSIANSFNWSTSLTTPLGSYTLSSTTTGTFYVDGPVTVTIHATFPAGFLLWSYGGEFSGGGTVLQFTNGTIVMPTAVPLLAALVGPYVTGGASLIDSRSTFLSEVNGGQPLAALNTAVWAPFNFADAVLFGHYTVTVPFLPVAGSGGESVEMNIPLGGIFASFEPITTTWPQYTYYDPTTETATTVLASEFPNQGTQFGGLVPELLNVFFFGL
jgi:hypothetical protein